MCIFALWIQPFTAHSANWNHPGFNWKLILQAARGCAYIHVSHSVRKLTGVKAHLDCSNPNLVPFYGKTANVEPHHHAVHFFTWFFCNRICLLQQHNTTQKYAIWWSGWSAVKILWWKVGSMPLKIRHMRRKLLCSSSGAVKSLGQGLPLGAKLKHSKLWRPCSIHILKHPFFWLSQPPLDFYTQIASSGVFL